VDLPGLLRLGSERHGEQDQGHCANECPAASH
jgi:hypothetical protein